MACFKGASPLSVRVGGAEGAGIGPPPKRHFAQSGSDCFLRRVALICLPLAKHQAKPRGWNLWNRSPGPVLALLWSLLSLVFPSGLLSVGRGWLSDPAGTGGCFPVLCQHFRSSQRSGRPVGRAGVRRSCGTHAPLFPLS